RRVPGAGLEDLSAQLLGLQEPPRPVMLQGQRVYFGNCRHDFKTLCGLKRYAHDHAVTSSSESFRAPQGEVELAPGGWGATHSRESESRQPSVKRACGARERRSRAASGLKTAWSRKRFGRAQPKPGLPNRFP